MKRSTARSLTVAAACLCAAPRLPAQGAPRFPMAAVPARGATVQAFVPAGWKAASQVTGDLDGDGRRDRVVHLVPRDTRDAPHGIPPAPGAQALLILLAERGGGLRRAGMATRLLQTVVPQWRLQLAIRRGVLVVDEDFGLEYEGAFTHRFRFERATGRFRLTRRKRYTLEPGGRHEGVETTENYLTGERLTTTSWWDGCGGGYLFHTYRRDHIPRTRAYFDDVDETPKTASDSLRAAEGRDAAFASPRDAHDHP